ncbi:MAG: SRPBCC family protein [Deltaproteobacteria bacterium]|nr:SRPBCC family protein [Deltaproteobacteria bacterium]
MWFELRKEDLSFRQRAPVVYINQAEIAAPRCAVGAAFCDAASWKKWFPNLRGALYEGLPPYGVGSIREAHVGSTRWREEMLLVDQNQGIAWTVTRSTVPFAHALVESFELSDSPNGTRVRWTFAMQPRLIARLGSPFAARVMGGVLQRAAKNLETYLQHPTRNPGS